jgi:hypothetical protein
MAEKINYGLSEAQRLGQAASAYDVQSAQSVTDLEQSYKDKVNELAKGIVTGMTQQEKDLLEKQVADLGNRYSQAISATQGQFAFAQQQAETTAAAMADQYAQMQDAQRALAEQALGAARTTTTPGGMTAAQRDAILQAQQVGAANLAYVGGAGAVPQELLAPEQRGTGGLMGVASLARNLYSQSLEAQKAASRAQLEGSRVNLQTALEARALESALAREQKERDRLREFELTGFNAVLAAKQERDNKLAELLAAAAGADTRTEKDKALAELDMYQKKSDIELKNQLKIIGAQAKASGSTGVSQAASDLDAEITGRASAFGKNLLNAIMMRPQGRPTGTSFNLGGSKINIKINGKPATIDDLWNANKLPAAFAVPGVAGMFYMSGNNVVHEVKVNGVPQAQYYPLENLNKQLNTLAGYLQKQKVSKDQAYAYANNVIGGLSDQERLALRYLLGTADPGAVAGILSVSGTKTPTPTSAPAKPATTTTKPVINLANPYGKPTTKK